MKDLLRTKTEFIAEYASRLMGCGVNTSRVIRNSKRLGQAVDLDVTLGVFQRSIILTSSDNDDNTHSEVVDIPKLPIDFEYNSELSGLSWEAYDKKLSFESIKQKYQTILDSPKMSPLIILGLVGCANASFCKLFGGDWYAMGIIFCSTILGFFVKQQLTTKQVNHFITCIITAFVASLAASTSLLFDITSDIALATSVLFLVPGVPLINGVIDVVEGYTLTGFSRLSEAVLIVICIATGLSFTLYLINDGLL